MTEVNIISTWSFYLRDGTPNHNNRQKTACNSTLAIGGVSSPLDSFVVAESSVLRTNFCAEKPAHRQSANRYLQLKTTEQ
jgi:hypothetical protein